MGLLLSPHLPSAAADYQAAVVDEMCDKVAIHTSASGAAAEMAHCYATSNLSPGPDPHPVLITLY